MSYLIDTDAIVHASLRPDAETILCGIEHQIDCDKLKTVEQVLDELRRWPDLRSRLVRRKSKFVIKNQYGPGIAAIAGSISDDFEFLFDMSGSRNPDPADPWLIAAAKHHGWCVITDERQASTKKIPYVCRQQSLLVRCIDGPSFFAEVGIVT
ncbi:DUF4411 family protein [Methylobacterium sp. J-030]|uniref:DUF4411 family protein n=1 Tax=Methylobacterium sp. J-030 TaxID=2836627 RepID=UPI00391D3F2B